MNRYDRSHTFFYLDPPYWSTEGYGVEFGFDNYLVMAELAKTIKAKLMISVNDIPEMREVFADLTLDTVDIVYTVGGAKNSKPARELIVRNW